MPIAREPVLHPVDILALRPTQMTVGMHEVQEKRKHWRTHKDKKKAELLGRHMIPVISGPNGRYYIIDHRIYQLQAIVPKSRHKSPLIHRFLDSFGYASDNSKSTPPI